ncbi:predicted protein [Nematostella vectensis]|uniref:Lipase n=2 Tax=Nematostella vectensis TaxID=45351 RepID=A7S6G4_NEMVE|nr:predicted protein [Nematostella vectensis]|eukprot:XP_001632807.1 predicted protein [Nematostella vectensis]
MRSLVFVTCLYIAHALPFIHREATTDEPPRDPDIDRNASQLIRNRGYPVEEHYVTTSDGFILNLQRIPHGRNELREGSGRKPVVFLQHGLLMDSTNWVLNSPHDSLGYILADKGFDVWLGNIRGNEYSAAHVKWNKDSSKFWDWTWQQMAQYDLPAMIDYVTLATSQSQVFYVGHSQGTLIGFTGFSANQELAKKIKMFFALAPVYTVAHVSEFIKASAYALFPVTHIFQNHVSEEFVPSKLTKMMSDAGVCSRAKSEELCYKTGETLFGFDSSNLNMSRVPVIMSHWGSGTSFKNMVHFGQMVTSGKCQKYNYGYFYNWMKYGQIDPPHYRVKDMDVPTVLFSGSHDTLADPLDVGELKPRIQNLVHSEEIPGWNHADFLFGMDAERLLYRKIVKMMFKRIREDNVPQPIDGNDFIASFLGWNKIKN